MGREVKSKTRGQLWRGRDEGGTKGLNGTRSYDFIHLFTFARSLCSFCSWMDCSGVMFALGAL